ncbi:MULTISPECIES: M48 family metallopeptidase [Mameliella]|uniref:M48 family metallopeptidase n=1 Tax=Mameliella TaxID=1434019 RepID=UPI000B531EF4|nr:MULTISPECIES: M48 family metallopeptidase [Mameliella]MCR9276093.1 M48 family metallopeptidase [Paracoccaceae bacterium]OWV61611.1 peptidase M48 Ste24p [Mameliella alba]
MSTVLKVGAHPPVFRGEGLFYDGQNAEARPIDLSINEQRGVLLGEGLDWPLDKIRQVHDVAGKDLVILRHRDDPAARLILTDKTLLARLPDKDRSAPIARRGRLAAWALGALASVALILFVLVPLMADQLAEYLPPEGEKALGEVTLRQIREALDDSGLQPIAFCTAPEGEQALRRIETRLTAQMDPAPELTVHVLNHDMVNAFALPGGHLVFFRGLIDEAGSPDEIAAVMAHEIGHVISRDPTRHALRSAGSIGVLGLIFGDFAGGAIVLLITEQLIEAQYSQGAEAEADAFAHDLMLRADLSPAALAVMFERFRTLAGGDAEGFIGHFLSHPRLGDRIAAARDAVPDGFRPRPLLEPVEWRALQGICDVDAAF